MHGAFVNFASVRIRDAAHNMTDPIGANANATMTRSASQSNQRAMEIFYAG